MVVSGWFVASFEQVTVYGGARERRLVAGRWPDRPILKRVQGWQPLKTRRLDRSKRAEMGAHGKNSTEMGGFFR